MSAEQHAAIARQWLFEVSSDGTDPAVFDRIVAPDCVIHGGFPGIPPGPAGGRRSHELATGFVEFRFDVEDLIAIDDTVVVRAVGRSLHKPGGVFYGIAGQGQQVDFAIVWWFRFADGRIAEIWRTADDLGRVFQLGGSIAPPVTP